MTTNLQLHRTRFPQWQRLASGWWAGQVFADGHWLQLEELNERLGLVHSADDLATCLADWNGSFALVWEGPAQTFVAVDIARSIPLFWQTAAGVTTITDQLDPAQAAPSGWLKEDWLVQTEFVPGHHTLLQGWQQLQAGEFLEIRDGFCYLHNYFPHRRPAEVSQDREDLKKQFSALIRAQTERLVSWAAGRTIVVPLSGGYDSRYILAALHQQGYPHLQAFTYGQADSWEVATARKVATTLGIDWQFVPYTSELLQKYWHTDWPAFAQYASNCAAIPQEQDYFALAHLRDTGWLAADSIICPGYCGDFQAGSYLPGTYFLWPWRRTKALQDLLYHRFTRYPTHERRQRWQPFLPQQKMHDPAEIVSEMEHWALREYVSKFIINGVRAYEWFDCSWYLPLWDREFIRFWQNVPNAYRKDLQLYREVLAADWFAPLGITYPEDEQNLALRRWWEDWLTVGAKAKLKQWRRPQKITDINGLQALVPLIQQELGWPEADHTKSVNEMLGHWYTKKLKVLTNQKTTT